MVRRVHLLAAAACNVVLICASVPLLGQHTGAATATVHATTAANAFTAALTPDQRAKAIYSFDSDKKASWHNLPPTMAPRAGVRLGELTADQRKAGMALLASVLSPYGYQKILNILDADRYLGEHIGVAFPTGPDAYSIALYGTPSTKEPWMLQLNGHHLGLNVTIAGSQKVMAPSLTGSYPDEFERDGKKMRALADETDRAFALMASLTQEQRRAAILPYAVDDLVLPPGQDGKVIQPEGLKASAMSARQRELLVSLVQAWVNILNEEASAAKIAQVKRNLSETFFAWSGGTTPGSNAYFRVQGPSLLIEYAPQVNPGDARTGTPNAPGFNNVGIPIRGPNGEDRRRSNHIHTIFRDFANDYGRQFTTH